MSFPVVPEMHVDQGDYRVSDLIGWQRDATLDLRPHFQRGSVWKERDKSFLIDSLVRGFPIPMIVLQHEERDGPTDLIRRVVDGQQRLRTIIAFVNRELLKDPSASDEWKYRPTGMGPRAPRLSFIDLPQQAQSRILQTRLSVATIEAGVSPGQVLEVYDRLNSTGSPLTAQELRYARRQGAFSTLCYELARANQSRWSDWKIFTETDVSRMKEVEFTAELLLLLMNGIGKTGRSEIDNAYVEHQDIVPNAERLEQRFRFCMDSLSRALAFPAKPDSIRTFRTRGWFYILFAWVDSHPEPSKALAAALPEVAHKIDVDRKTNAELVRSVTGSASDKASRDARYKYLTSALQEVLG